MACEDKYSKAYREAETPEQRVERLARQRQRNDVYYANHAEELRVYARRYRLEHPETSDKLREYFTRYPEMALRKNAKQRARRFGVPFNITADDIKTVIPADGVCPIMLQPFECGVGKVGPKSMTLDRVIPKLGYVPGNIGVISHLANTMKQDCTDPYVFCRLAEWLENPVRPASGLGPAPPRYMIKTARQRARKSGIPFSITATDIRACIPDDGRCPITGCTFERGHGKVGPDSMSLDRINPTLGYVPGNIAVISHLANTIKQRCTDPAVFRRLAVYITQARTLLNANVPSCKHVHTV